MGENSLRQRLPCSTQSRPKTMMVDDINARVETERALREAEEFATRLIACSQDCIKVLDLEGRLQWMNEGGMQALEICDFSPLENASWIDFWEGGDREAARAAVGSAAQGGTGRFTGFSARP
jgi:PAS domain-containing protein